MGTRGRTSKGYKMADLPVLEGASLAIKDGLIAWIGTHEEAQELKATERIDGEGKLVTPGLVDPHTHLVFGGSREHEMALKQQGSPVFGDPEAGRASYRLLARHGKRRKTNS